MILYYCVERYKLKEKYIACYAAKQKGSKEEIYTNFFGFVRNVEKVERN